MRAVRQEVAMALTRTIKLGTPAEEGLAAARRAADAAAAELGECTCMAFFDRQAGRELPAHASECHGDGKVPGYEEYAVNRGATGKVVVNRGDYVFIYRSLSEFIGL